MAYNNWWDIINCVYRVCSQLSDFGFPLSCFRLGPKFWSSTLAYCILSYCNLHGNISWIFPPLVGYFSLYKNTASTAVILMISRLQTVHFVFTNLDFAPTISKHADSYNCKKEINSKNWMELMCKLTCAGWAHSLQRGGWSNNQHKEPSSVAWGWERSPPPFADSLEA